LNKSKKLLSFIQWLEGAGIYLHFYSESEKQWLPIHYISDIENLIEKYRQRSKNKEKGVNWL